MICSAIDWSLVINIYKQSAPVASAGSNTVTPSSEWHYDLQANWFNQYHTGKKIQKNVTLTFDL